MTNKFFPFLFPNNEFLIIISVILTLCTLDLSFRSIKTRLSGNIMHMQSVSALVTKIDSTKGTSILFLGNSLIGEAIDAKSCTDHLQKLTMKNPSIFKIVPDGSDLPTWYFILKNKFIKRSVSPNLIVIGFAWNNALCDQMKMDGLYLAEFPCKLTDLPILYSFGLNKPEPILEFISGKASGIFANHEILRNRTLDIIIPYYRQEVRNLNSFQKNKKIKHLIKNDPLTYNRLLSFFDLADKAGIKMVFLSMPIHEQNYEIAPELRFILEKRSTLIDCRSNIDGFKPDEMFKDEIHLNEKGRDLFSNFISAKLAPIVSSLPLNETKTQ
jgi:hypothetical protein